MQQKQKLKHVQYSQQALYACDFLDGRDQLNDIKRDMFELYLKLKKDPKTNPKLLLNVLVQLKDTTLDYMQLVGNVMKIPDTKDMEFRIAGIDKPESEYEKEIVTNMENRERQMGISK